MREGKRWAWTREEGILVWSTYNLQWMHMNEQISRVRPVSLYLVACFWLSVSISTWSQSMTAIEWVRTQLIRATNFSIYVCVADECSRLHNADLFRSCSRLLQFSKFPGLWISTYWLYPHCCNFSKGPKQCTIILSFPPALRCGNLPKPYFNWNQRMLEPTQH